MWQCCAVATFFRFIFNVQHNWINFTSRQTFRHQQHKNQYNPYKDNITTILTEPYVSADFIRQINKICHVHFNPLTPVLPVTALDEPWPFFHFWRHHFWPKLSSSILNFQWCPDQSDRAKGAWDMHKNAQKVEQTTQTKISCHYTWLLHGKASPVEGQSLQQKGKKRKKRKGKKFQKLKGLKTYLKILFSAHGRFKMS